jgi:hypothetical protein
MAADSVKIGAGSERKGVGHDPGAVAALGQDPAELDGFHVDVLAARSGPVLASGRSGEGDGEGLTVGARPFGDDVGDDAAVVVGVEIERLGRCPSQVDPVHPHIAGEADVEEIGDKLAANRGGEVEQR